MKRPRTNSRPPYHPDPYAPVTVLDPHYPQQLPRSQYPLPVSSADFPTMNLPAPERIPHGPGSRPQDPRSPEPHPQERHFQDRRPQERRPQELRPQELRPQELRPYPGPAPGQAPQFFSSSQPGFSSPPAQPLRHHHHHHHPPPVHPIHLDQPTPQIIPSIGQMFPDRHIYPPSTYGESGEQQQAFPGYHSHTLPGHGEDSAPEPRGSRRRNNPVHVSVVGAEGFPSPAPRREERARFTPEDDRKLKALKEQYDLTWRQIEEFFPGRQSGTLQVRYCTKLKDRQEINWTQNHDQRLQAYIRDYDANKWKAVSTKMGHNFTAQACEERERELHELSEPVGPEAYE